MENYRSPLIDSIISQLACRKLRYFLLACVTESWRHRKSFLTGIVLKVPTIGGGSFYFPKEKDEAKRFFKEASPRMQIRIPCLFSRIVKISIPNVLHEPQRHNSPADISPPFG